MQDTEIRPVITQDGITLVETQQEKFFHATPLGCLIWLGLRDGFSCDQLIEKIVVERRVSEESARRGLFQFLDQLSQKSLIPIQVSSDLSLRVNGSNTQEREMRSWPLVSDSDLELVFSWLGDGDNARWFDFGREPLSVPRLRGMATTKNDLYTLYGRENTGTPVALAALSDVNHKTANLWIIVSKQHRRQGYGLWIAQHMMETAFEKLELDSIHACVPEPNVAALRMIQRAGWKYSGRQRHSHCLSGHLVDKLNVDILRAEYFANKNTNKTGDSTKDESNCDSDYTLSESH